MTHKKLLYIGVLASLASFWAAPAMADEVNLAGTVGVERTVLVDGAETKQFVEPKSVVPGDRLRFVTSYRNDSDQPVDNFVLTNPLPAAVTLVAPADGFEVSVDGTQFSALADARVSDRKGGMRPAIAADVTHVRWTLRKLNPGQSGTVEYFAAVR